MKIPGKDLIMKLPTVEKVVIMIIIVLITVIFLNIRSCNKLVDKEGGIKQVIVNIGKEVKSIKKEIAQD